MKIKIFGYTGSVRPSPTEMIQKELVDLGCEVVEKEADCILETCGLYKNAQKFWNEDGKKAVRIFNLLDVNNQNPNFYDQAWRDYEDCEIACTISNTVKAEIREKFRTFREIHVINFPIRPVSHLKYPRGITSLYVGRFNCPNKRTWVINPTLQLLTLDPENHLIVAGSERPPMGFFIENPGDVTLNELYNASEFTWLPSVSEGIGLTCCESTICGSIPLLANDSPVVRELGLKEFSVDPKPAAFVQLIKKIQKNPEYYWNIMDELRPVFLNKFSPQTIAKNILNLYNSYVGDRKS